MKVRMLVARKILVVLIGFGLTLGTMTTNSLAAKHTFAKPCPMEHVQADSKKPCCPPEKCDHALMSCAAKCAASIGALILPSATIVLLASRAQPSGVDIQEADQLANGPA